jgi:hypothetical protein
MGATLVLLISTAAAIAVNEANKQFLASSEEQRRTAFQIILAGAGETCNSVVRTYFQGETPAGQAIWDIDCGRDNAYRISIAPDEGASSKLISCRSLRQIKREECFKPLAPERR